MVERFRVENTRVEPQVTMIANSNWQEFTIRYVADYRKRRAPRT